MKQDGTETAALKEEIDRALSAVGVSASPEQRQLLARHARLVLKANERMNLTRITETRAVAELHVADSLAFTRHVAPLKGRIVDIGAGAGYPGLPLAIVGHDVHLCESVKKKAAFLEQCVADLGLECTVHGVRAEELAVREPGSADVVVARAVSALASLVELASPLLREGGRLIALKGAPTAVEETQGRVAAKMCGMREVGRSDYLLPGGESRAVVEYERGGKPRLSLPRSPGMAQRHPFGGSST